MEGTTDRRPLVPLLGIIAGLLFLLVLCVAVTGLIFIRTANTAKEALVQELPARQEDTARKLSAAALRTNGQIDEFQRRRQDLEGTPAGPLDKLDRMIRLQQLLADEQLALLRHMEDTQLAVAQSTRPLPAQERAAEKAAEADAKNEPQGRKGERRDRTQARTTSPGRSRAPTRKGEPPAADAPHQQDRAPERPPPTAPDEESTR